VIETILTIVTNILNHQGEIKYYQINVANPNFNRRVGKMSGAISILIALGFREEESGSLALSIETNLKNLEARRLELEIGLNLLRDRLASGVLGGIDTDEKKEDQMGGKLPARPTTALTVANEMKAADITNISPIRSKPYNV
jgi:hypothetical protein